MIPNDEKRHRLDLSRKGSVLADLLGYAFAGAVIAIMFVYSGSFR